MVVSNKFTFGKQDFKYFIDCRDNKKIRPLCIFFPEVSIYKRHFDKNKCMYFMIKDKNNFYKYIIIVERVSDIMKKKFNSELKYNKFYLKVERKIQHKRWLSMFLYTSNII